MDEAIVTTILFLSILVLFFVAITADVSPVYEKAPSTPVQTANDEFFNDEEQDQNESIELSERDGFVVIEGSNMLVYNMVTHIVFYMFETSDETGNTVGFLSPYVSKNGLFCFYADGNLVEIVDNSVFYYDENPISSEIIELSA